MSSKMIRTGSCLGLIFSYSLISTACGSSQKTPENKAAENRTVAVSTSKTPTEAVNSSSKNSVEENKTAPAEIAKPSPTVKENSGEEMPDEDALVDIAKLANLSPAEIDKILGQPIEKKAITVPKKGEYRVYKIAGEPKGLAVRFYGGRAKNFNLILSAPVSTARGALKQTFAIDVGSQPPLKDAKEPLSEKWSGKFGGVNFSNVYAKRESANGGFVFVLAEVAN